MSKKEVEITSMLYWWPKVKDLGIPIPKTEIVEVPYKALIGMLDGKPIREKYMTRIIEAGRTIEYPLFLRTDLSSGKHQWLRTCFVPDEKVLPQHIYSVVERNAMAGIFGLNCEAIVLRELLDLESPFVAFVGMPVAKERRYFVRDGSVECHHPYWIEHAIATSYPPPQEEDWQRLLAVINQEDIDEIRLLTVYATSVGKTLGGYWSVDFAHSEDGIWYLIDMADGDKSYHPEH